MLQTILLVVQIFVSIALVLIILVQKSEGSGLISSSSGSPSSFMTARGAANFLTRATSILAALFIGLNLALAILAGNHGQGASLLDQLPAGPAAPKPTAPEATPNAPNVPAPTLTPTVAPGASKSAAVKPVAPAPDVPLTK